MDELPDQAPEGGGSLPEASEETSRRAEQIQSDASETLRNATSLLDVLPMRRGAERPTSAIEQGTQRTLESFQRLRERLEALASEARGDR
jgi:ABC-type branched-subunit amino acid transport system ATPase component